MIDRTKVSLFPPIFLKYEKNVRENQQAATRIVLFLSHTEIFFDMNEKDKYNTVK